MTKLQCCPTSDGAAATVICSQRFLDKHPHLKPQAVEIAGQALTTDDVALLGGSAIELVGAEMTRRAAEMVYKESGIGPKDVQVVECHDCFSANEMYSPVLRMGVTEGFVLMRLGWRNEVRHMNLLRMEILRLEGNILSILLVD